MQEGGGLQDGAVNVGLGREVDDGVRLSSQLPHQRLVGDVSLDEAVAVARGRVVREAAEVGGVTGIGELVDHDEVVIGGSEAPMREVGADEAGPAGDQDPHAFPPPPALCVTPPVSAPSLAVGSR